MKKLFSIITLLCFLITSIMGPNPVLAQDIRLPAPGTMVALSPAYAPALIKGLTIHKDNPFLFDFIVDTGHSGVEGQALKNEADRLIKYFFACLTIPEKDLWVNLSPYEKDRIAPAALGQTEMGRDLLGQDYLLKQLTASLIYPEKNLGKEFWGEVYAKAQQQYGTTQIPMNTFNKVWILADKATVYEHDQTAFVVSGHLKVMLEEDYLALQKHSSPSLTHSIASQVVRQIILPEIEKEVNQGRNFAQLRQIFNSLILATWYKKNLKEALLNQVYANKNTVRGVEGHSNLSPEEIYQQYLKAYKKGVFNYIKDTGTPNGISVPRKYFSGGFGVNEAMLTTVSNDPNIAQVATRHTGFLVNVTAGANVNGQTPLEDVIKRYELNPSHKNEKKLIRAVRAHNQEVPYMQQVIYEFGKGLRRLYPPGSKVEILESKPKSGDQAMTTQELGKLASIINAVLTSPIVVDARSPDGSPVHCKFNFTAEVMGEGAEISQKEFKLDESNIRQEDGGKTYDVPITIRLLPGHFPTIQHLNTLIVNSIVDFFGQESKSDVEGAILGQTNRILINIRMIETITMIPRKKEQDAGKILTEVVRVIKAWNGTTKVSTINLTTRGLQDLKVWNRLMEGGTLIPLQSGLPIEAVLGQLSAELEARRATNPVALFIDVYRPSERGDVLVCSLITGGNNSLLKIPANLAMAAKAVFSDKLTIEVEKTGDYRTITIIHRDLSGNTPQFDIYRPESESVQQTADLIVRYLKEEVQRHLSTNSDAIDYAYGMVLSRLGSTISRLSEKDRWMHAYQERVKIDDVLKALDDLKNDIETGRMGPDPQEEDGWMKISLIKFGKTNAGIKSWLAIRFFQHEKKLFVHFGPDETYISWKAPTKIALKNEVWAWIEEKKKEVNNMPPSYPTIMGMYGRYGPAEPLSQAMAATVQQTPGGIDLNSANIGMTVTKDASGGVKVDFDPALIERIRHEGVQSVVPVIINIQPMNDLDTILGLPAKHAPA